MLGQNGTTDPKKLHPVNLHWLVSLSIIITLGNNYAPYLNQFGFMSDDIDTRTLPIILTISSFQRLLDSSYN